MKTATVSVALAAVILAAAPEAGHAAWRAPSTVACNVQLNVIDPDPKGLNVRSAPGMAGRVVTVLKHSDWTQVHVTAQSGEWYSIDRAVRYDDDNSDGVSDLKRGQTGWVHAGKLGGVRANGHGAIYAAPNDRGKPIYIFSDDESKIPPLRILGCEGAFVKVEMAGTWGWTRSICSNQRTTCS